MMDESAKQQLEQTRETQPAWNSTLHSRQRVLLHTQPLVTLQQKWKLGTEDQAHYDALTLSIKLFDAIIDGSGFGNEVTRETMLQSLRPLLAAFDDATNLDPNERRHLQVVDRLIGYLKNDANRGRAFEVEYADFDDRRQLDRKVLRFKLLKEMHGYSGEIVLQLSSEAINLFLNALDLDIESAQEANEAVVRFQLERGKFDQARAFAENARGQSLRYQEKIEHIVGQTKRDVRQVDWRNEVHELLVEAMDHVQNRQRIESDIIDSAQQKLATVQLDEDQRHAVGDVIRLMRDCRHRHLNLNRQLMQTRNHFFEQQTRQCFSDSESITPINLRDEVLQPLLAMPQADVVPLGEYATSLLATARTPKLLSLAGLIIWQLQPLRIRTEGEVEMEELDLLESGVEVKRFDDDVLQGSEKVFVELDRAIVLSELIQRLETDGCPDEVQDAVVLRILEQFDPEDGIDGFEVAMHEKGGFAHHRMFGDDLLICPQRTTT